MSATILYPTDYSPGSREILKLATAIARDKNARLLIAHVTMLEKTPVGELFDDEPEPDPAELDRLKEVLPPDPGVPFEHRLVYGEPGSVETTRASDAIVKLAEQEKVNTIVMGTHGRTGLANVLMGSVAEAVHRNAPCTVVAVKLPPGASRTTEEEHRKLDRASVDALNQALLAERFSLAIYLRDGRQRTHPGDEPLEEAVRRIANDHERYSDRITKLLSDHVGRVPHGNFPMDFAEHDDETALDFLLPELIRHEQRIVEQITQALESVGPDTEVCELLQGLLRTEKAHVEALTKIQKTLRG
jgi:universal stress protein A